MEEAIYLLYILLLPAVSSRLNTRSLDYMDLAQRQPLLMDELFGRRKKSKTQTVELAAVSCWVCPTGAGLYYTEFLLGGGKEWLYLVV